MSFESLIAEALDAPFEGWGFDWLRGRTRIEPAPWSYPREVARLARNAETMLDMGTGGGEVLARLPARAPFTVATEGWAPNVGVAANRLRPFGIPVVHYEGAPDNIGQDASTPGRLPFDAETFDLVTNRHESFEARDVARVLRPHGTFVTQQIDSRAFDDIYDALELTPPGAPESWLPLAEQQTRTAGLTALASHAGAERIFFNDVGALVYYLKAVTWAVLGFDVDDCRPALERLHERLQTEPLLVRQRRFLLIATKP